MSGSPAGAADLRLASLRQPWTLSLSTRESATFHKIGAVRLASPRCRPSHAPSRGLCRGGCQRSRSSSLSTTTARWGSGRRRAAGARLQPVFRIGSLSADRGGVQPNLQARRGRAAPCRDARPVVLEVSPALRAWAVTFLAWPKKRHNRAATLPIRPLRGFPRIGTGRTDRRRRHIPVPTAAAPSSPMAL